jgi:hypothetical protein
VRCCSDKALPGYIRGNAAQQRQCARGNGGQVYAESQFRGTTGGNGCLSNQRWMGAAAVCAADGARLCTAAEIMKGCTRGTGCQHDTDLIWSDTPCTSPRPYYKVVIGRSTSQYRALASGTVQCAARNEPHEVRCCADRQVPGYRNSTGRGRCNLRVFSDSSFNSGSGLRCVLGGGRSCLRR